MTDGHAVIMLIVGDVSLDPTNLAALSRVDGAAEQWARDRLSDAIGALPSRCAILTPGRPHGPERWAIEIAQSYRRTAGQVAGSGLELVEIRADGLRTSLRGDDATRWGGGGTYRSEIVRRAVKAAKDGWDVVVIAFVRPGSDSLDPTVYSIVAESRSAGLRVIEQQYEG